MSPFQQFIDALNDEELGQLLAGSAGITCDAHGYRLAKSGPELFEARPTPAEARKSLMEREHSILSQLFAQQPLCRAEFDYQAATLVSAHGIARFCRHWDNRTNWALMIDEWQLTAVGPEDVRSQYGYFATSDTNLNEAAAEAQVMAWLKSGEAYEDYRTKTHCRYCR